MAFFCEKLLPLPWLYLAQDYRVLKKNVKKTLADTRSRSVLLVTMTSMTVLGLDVFPSGSFWEDRWGETVGSYVCLVSCVPWGCLSCPLRPYLSLPILTTVICQWLCQHSTHFAGGEAASLIWGSVGVSYWCIYMYICMFIHKYMYGLIIYTYVCIKTSCLICRNYIMAKSFNQLGSHLDEYQNTQFE